MVRKHNKKNILFFFALLVLTCMCSKKQNLNDDFVDYLFENKEKMSIYLVNEEIARELTDIYRNFTGDLSEIYEMLNSVNFIFDDNRLVGNYRIKNNFEEELIGYEILKDESISIGKHITMTKRQENETDILLTFFLTDEGGRLLKEFTTNNINNYSVIVFENKIIASFMLLRPIEKSFGFYIWKL